MNRGNWFPKLTTQEVQERIKPLRLAEGQEWRNAHTKYRFICPKGHEWETVGLVVINANRGCPECNGKPKSKLSAEEVARRLKNLSLSLVGDYKGMRHDNRFKCVLGHEWETNGGNVLLLGRGCPECWRLRLKNRYI